MRGSTDSFIPPTKPDFYTLTKHQSPPICLSAKEHGIKRFTFKSFFLNMLQLLLLMQWLEYILNSNIIYYAVDIDKNYEQKTHFARIKSEVEEFSMSGVGVDFVHEWGESDWRVGAADLSYLQPRHQALGSGIRVVKTSLLWRVAGLFLIHRMRSLVIWEGLRVEPLLLPHIMVVWTSEQDASWGSPRGGILPGVDPAVDPGHAGQIIFLVIFHLNPWPTGIVWLSSYCGRWFSFQFLWAKYWTPIHWIVIACVIESSTEYTAVWMGVKHYNKFWPIYTSHL